MDSKSESSPSCDSGGEGGGGEGGGEGGGGDGGGEGGDGEVWPDCASPPASERLSQNCPWLPQFLYQVTLSTSQHCGGMSSSMHAYVSEHDLGSPSSELGASQVPRLPPPLHFARAGASSKPSRSQAHTRWLACRRHLLGGPDASTVSAAAAEAAAVLRADEPKSSPNALGAAPGRPRRHASAGSAGLWSNPSPAARAARRRRTRFVTRAIKKKSRLADDSPSCAAIGPGGLAVRPDRACTVRSQPVCVSSAAVLGAVTSVWAVTSDGRDGSSDRCGGCGSATAQWLSLLHCLKTCKFGLCFVGTWLGLVPGLGLGQGRVGAWAGARAGARPGLRLGPGLRRGRGGWR